MFINLKHPNFLFRIQLSTGQSVESMEDNHGISINDDEQLGHNYIDSFSDDETEGYYYSSSDDEIQTPNSCHQADELKSSLKKDGQPNMQQSGII